MIVCLGGFKRKRSFRPIQDGSFLFSDRMERRKGCNVRRRYVTHVQEGFDRSEFCRQRESSREVLEG